MVKHNKFLLVIALFLASFFSVNGQVSKNYQHWADGHVGTNFTAQWQGDILSANKSSYFEGEVISHVYAIPASNQKPFVQNQSYSFTIVHNWYQGTTNAGGFAYVTTYNVSRPATPLPGTNQTIVEDASFTNGSDANGQGMAGVFYCTENANITGVSAPSISNGSNKDRTVTVTFTYTGATTTSGYVVIYFGLAIAYEGVVPNQGKGTTQGAHAWSGGSLQTTVSSAFTGALSIQLAPSAILVGSISGIKYKDLNNNGNQDAGEPPLSGWTIYLDLNNNGNFDTGEPSRVTDANGAYSFPVSKDADKTDGDNDPWIVREVGQTGWTQTEPVNPAYYSVTIDVGNLTATGKDFGNFTCATYGAPKVTLIDASLCGSVASPSITVCSPLVGAYKLTQTGETDKTFNYDGTNGPVTFSNLALGKSGFSLVYTDANGCSSDPADCDDIVTTCPSSANRLATTADVIEATIQAPTPTKVLAAPNPFNDRIRFSLQSAVSGRGSLELYNMLGQRVTVVFEGNVQKGVVQNIEYSVPGSKRSNLIYVFKVGDQKVSGKLIGLK
jgi:hypothetical protein